MDELKAAFLEEADELFSEVEDILIRAEDSGELDNEDINFLFRNVHTLKGGSGSVGFEKFVEIVHIFENFLDKLRNNEIKVTPEIVSFLVDSLSELRDILEEEAEDSLDEDEFQEKLNYIKKEIEKFSNFESKLEDSTEILDLLKELTKNINDSDIDEVFRAFHTIKANAQILNYRELADYVHTIEEFLLKIKDGEIEFNDKVRKFLKEEIERINDILNKEFKGESIDSQYFDELEEKIDNLTNSSTSSDEGFELFDEDEGYELFDEEEKKDEGFELFDEDQGFELFDEEEVKKEEKVKEAPKEEKLEKQEKKEEKTKEKTEEKKVEKKVEKKEIKKEKKADKKDKKSLSSLVSSSSIRVNLEKIDTLMNKVADLVITKSMIYQIADSIDDVYQKLLYERLEILDRNIRELQEAVMSIRMVPMESIYQKLPKIIRDIAKKVGKKVRFQAYGGNVEIDKLMIEALMDPLTHILRNAIDHGIEPEEERIKAGKPPEGRITISATQESGQIIITIEDDGRGIDLDKVVKKAIEKGIIDEYEAEKLSDEEKAMLIFSPGLSTAEKVSDISGRGVGMDVVMNNITSIGGSIKVKTQKGVGTKFIIILPLTLAILDGLNVRVGKDRFIYPVNMIVESFQPREDMVQHLSPTEEVLMLRGEFIPIIRLYKFFRIEPEFEDITKGIVIISKVEDTKYALFIDEFLNQEQIVVKSLEKNFKKVLGISATTIKGDGSIGLILDIINIVKEHKKVIYGNYSV